MADKASWIVIAPQVTNAGAAQVPDEATAFAIEIVEVSKRYDAPHRAAFFATLLHDLEIAHHLATEGTPPPTWRITNSLPDEVSSVDMDYVMHSFGEAIEVSMHRYKPTVRIDAFDLLIERLTEERERLFDQLVKDEKS